MPCTFARSTDYELIQEILKEPRCFRRMTQGLLQAEALTIGPVRGIEYILARVDSAPAAVFLIVGGRELHFCFVPAFWGRSLPIARGFMAWLWENTAGCLYSGAVPSHNRLALQLALRVGFIVVDRRGGIVLTQIERPT